MQSAKNPLTILHKYAKLPRVTNFAFKYGVIFNIGDHF